MNTTFVDLIQANNFVLKYCNLPDFGLIKKLFKDSL